MGGTSSALLWSGLGLALASSCATARLAQQPAFTPPDPGLARTVVVEPLFELAQLTSTTRTEYAQRSSVPTDPIGVGVGFGGGFGGFAGSSTVAITREVQEKPFFAQPQTLAALHAQVLGEVRRRRPAWRVVSTSQTPTLREGVVLVRTIIGGNELVSSDRPLKTLAFGFGLVLWPLQLVNLSPVEETTRVRGLLERYQLDASAVAQRLVRYPTQPDFAVSVVSQPSLRREFGLEVTIQEGVLADERPRAAVLVEGFVDRLASAIIALVEEP